MQLVVKLTPEAAAKVTGGAEGSPPTGLAAALEPRGLAPAPMHPGTDDPDLQAYLTVEVDDRSAQELIDELGRVDDVEAAYVQPGPELP